MWRGRVHGRTDRQVAARPAFSNCCLPRNKITPTVRAELGRYFIPRPRWRIGIVSCRLAASSMSTTKTSSLNWRPRRGGSLPIAGSTGMRAVWLFIRHNGRFSPRVQRRCATRSTTARLAVGPFTGRHYGRCLPSWHCERKYSETLHKTDRTAAYGTSLVRWREFPGYIFRSIDLSSK